MRLDKYECFMQMFIIIIETIVRAWRVDMFQR